MDWITTKQACELSEYHPDYLRTIIRAGKIRAKKWGREWQVSRKSLEAHLRQVEKLGERRGRKKSA